LKFILKNNGLYPEQLSKVVTATMGTDGLWKEYCSCNYKPG